METTVLASEDTPSRAVALDVKNLSVDFKIQDDWIRVVDDVSFQIRRGEILGLVGESGSGKTVTSLAVMGLLPRGRSRRSGVAQLGDVELLSLEPRRLNEVRGSKIAMVFQEPMTSLNPAFTIGEQISETVRNHRGLARKEAWRVAVAALDTVGIPDAGNRASHYPHEFSGGMRQRAMLAMALSCEPDVLIADEPTTALDVTVQAQMLQLVKDLQADLGMAVLFVTHDLGVVAEITDRVIVMYAGHVVEQACSEDLFEDPWHPYTSALLAARLRVGGPSGRLPTIPGSVPLPGTAGDGCRFINRCGFAQDNCESPLELRHSTGDREIRCVRAEELIQLRGTR